MSISNNSLMRRSALHFWEAIRLALNLWRRQSLLARFLIAGPLVLLAGMMMTGLWVTNAIKSGVTNTATAAAALHMDEFVAKVHPLVQELEHAEHLSDASRAQLDRLAMALANSGIVGIKVWRIDGTIAYSTWPELVGQRFAISDSFQRAFTGKFAIELEGEASDGNAPVIGSSNPMLEIYAPVRSDSSGRIVAIAEYYSIGSELSNELYSAERSSWIVVAAIGSFMLAALSGIVFSGSRTIDVQRRTLRTQVADLEILVKTNEELRDSVKRAHARSVEIHERLLRRVGADLHDGPAQLLSLALLLSHALEPGSEVQNKPDKLKTVKSALNDSLREIRSISAGLMLPEITTADLEHVIRTATQSHATHTGTAVSCNLALQSKAVPDALKVCCYRFVQEALNNAFKHAGGKGQSVEAIAANHVIQLKVSDQGPGLRPSGSPGDNCGMGLIGMRDRIETLGGKLDIVSSSDGCRLTASFDLREVNQLDFIS